MSVELPTPYLIEKTYVPVGDIWVCKLCSRVLRMWQTVLHWCRLICNTCTIIKIFNWFLYLIQLLLSQLLSSLFQFPLYLVQLSPRHVFACTRCYSPRELSWVSLHWGILFCKPTTLFTQMKITLSRSRTTFLDLWISHIALSEG